MNLESRIQIIHNFIPHSMGIFNFQLVVALLPQIDQISLFGIRKGLIFWAFPLTRLLCAVLSEATQTSFPELTASKRQRLRLVDLVVDFAESSSTVEVPVAPRSSIEIHNSSNIVEFRECTNCEQMVRDRCPCLTFLLFYPFLNGGKWDHVHNTILCGINYEI